MIDQILVWVDVNHHHHHHNLIDLFKPKISNNICTLATWLNHIVQNHGYYLNGDGDDDDGDDDAHDVDEDENNDDEDENNDDEDDDDDDDDDDVNDDDDDPPHKKQYSQKIDHPHFGNENKLEHFINTTNYGGRKMRDGSCLTNVQKTEILLS